MFELKKRNKGLNNSEHTTYDIYMSYREECKKRNKKPVNITTFRKVIKAGNHRINKYIIEDAQIFQMPYRLGGLGIIRFDRTFKIERKHKWPIDWKESRENNMLIYHEDPFIFKWAWIKRKAIVSGITTYKFKAVRTNMRAISKARRELNMQYFKEDKYDK